MLKIPTLVFSSAVLITAPVAAQSIDAHTHGAATLDIAMDGATIEVRFSSPAEDIFGFEHEAMNERQRQIIASTSEKMATAQWLFGDSLPSSCTVQSSHVTSGLNETGSADTDGHAHEHDHEEHAMGDEHEEHAEVVADYRIECQQNRPDSLHLQAFVTFPSLQSIEVQWISETNQGGASLNANRNTISFSGN